MTLYEVYKEWRELTEELQNDFPGTSVDCGESKVRKAFSNYAGLSKEITFEKMLSLEKQFAIEE